MSSPDKEDWKEEVKNEHNRMVKHKVWKGVPRSAVPKGAKILTSTWAMKKKSNGKLRGRINARGFEQKDGEHYDSTSIASPVANDVTIRVVLVLMLLARWCSALKDIQGAFLHGEFWDGEVIYMEVPQCF